MSKKGNSLFEENKKEALNITIDSDLKEKIKDLSKSNKISTSKIVNLILRKLEEDGKLEDLKQLETFLKD